ncbi:MAG: hypothetical protein ACRDCQ_05240, partial [Aeromonas sobria]
MVITAISDAFSRPKLVVSAICWVSSGISSWMRRAPVITPFTYLPPAIESQDATLAEALAQGLPLQLLLIAEEQKEALLTLPVFAGVKIQLALGQKAPFSLMHGATLLLVVFVA